MRLVNTNVIALLIIASNAITSAQVIRKDFVQSTSNERSKRAIDFGLFVRNLLLKSATASNAKANIARNVINSKTTTAAPRRRTTTTTTAIPFFFNKGPFKFPFDLSGPINNKFNNGGGGYINFDYNDYGGQQTLRPGRRRRPSSTTTTTTTAAPPPSPSPAPARRRPLPPRRPYGIYGKQKLPQFDYYDDYDYDYADEAPSSSAAPTTVPAPMPNPPVARSQKRPVSNRKRTQGRVSPLRNRFVYQFRQPYDTSINNDAASPATNQNPPTPNNNSNNNNNDETSTNTNDYTDDGNVNKDDDDDDDANADAVNNDGGEDVNSDPIVADNNNNPNDSSDNANPNINSNANSDNGNGNVSSAPAPPLLRNSNFNFNANLPQFQGQFGIGGNVNGAPGFNNFGPPAGFQYSPYNDFNSPYQPSSPTGYSVRYY